VVQTKPVILLIEGKRAGHPSFLTGLAKKGYQVENASTGSEALALLADRLPNLVLVDAASMRSNGRRICQSIRQQAQGLPIVLVVDNDSANVDRVDANVVLTQPFTLQKLLNRIRPLLPIVQKNVLKAGPMQLDTEQRWARCLNRQARLTPRLVMLLKALMERAGELIERKELFKIVWETDYAGDTRTLDVHVSWLRQALEEDPRHPEYIKTVRGVGYRLDIETEPIHLPRILEKTK
jgi:DNA-binding response OmpR family regulator